ncbi:complement C1q-like protein 2 [Saccostrea echinata]|uniref:complement C1q-like protein 2 n=1 Tax=Saccostrea echinata TaxID=191078 RepID=UPI002A82C1DF|nr:complement C1q-like protein 2 [Saccostrea echinata]
MYLNIILCVLSIYFSSLCGQITTNASDAEPDLSVRLSLLERTVGRILTWKDQVNLTSNRTSGGIPVFNSTPVAFCARFKNDHGGISVGFILKFDVVITNLGNHYNPTDGIFIAPVHGVYMFYWTMQCYYSGSTHCGTALKINNVMKGRIRSADANGGYYHTGSNSVIVEVAAGSHVWIENVDWSNVDIYEYSSFGGTLLLIL